MKRFPEESDLSGFVGPPLEMICCTINTMSLHFGRDTFLDIWVPFAHLDASGVRTEVGPPIPPGCLFELLEHPGRRCRVTDEGLSLILEFDNGRCLSLASMRGYESVHIHDRGTVTIV